MACSYKGGVVLGADGRVSTGIYVSNRSSMKITALTDNVCLLRSGSAADTQAVADYVRHFANQLSMETGDELGVETVANLVRQVRGWPALCVRERTFVAWSCSWCGGKWVACVM